MNKKLKIALVASFLFTGAMSICIINAASETNSYKQVSSTDYALSLNEGVDVENDCASIKNDRGASFEFKLSYYTKGNGVLGSFDSSGELLNYTAFHSLSSISINLDSGSFDFYTGWKQYENSEISYSSEAFEHISGTGVTYIDLSSIKPSYFKLVATNQTVVRTLTLNYGCTENPTAKQLRLKIDAPTVGSNGQISDSNYVWVNTNITNIEASKWSDYLMTKAQDGSWYCDFTDISVANSGYGLKFWVSDSNTEITSWESEYSSGSDINFGIGEGQTEFNISGVTFESQPTPISGEYTLNLTITTTGTATSFGNIQFVYNYSNSTSQYKDWIQFDTSWKSKYEVSFQNLDTSKTLYFRIYMWAHSQGVYVGDGDGSSNFSIIHLQAAILTPIFRLFTLIVL